jgi:nucleoside-diphosphate-sugar epimerase
MRAVNVSGTMNVYEAARKHAVQGFCHLSSVGVIGKVRERVVDEDTACHPMNLYGETKLEAEHVLARGLEDGRLLILRPTNIFSQETFNIAKYTTRCNALRVRLTGRERAHLVYVEDVVAAAIQLLETTGNDACQTYIVSSDDEEGNIEEEVYDFVRQLLGRPISTRKYVCSIKWADRLRLLRRGLGNRGDVLYSSRRLFATGFRMPFGWREGMRRVVASRQRQPMPVAT